ncbi:MAG: M20/M25/M40 family metallo-hydrolase [Planctomycetes bacterium]|nr:M20/M25/M40 family metallo-hydrolase [Planctomycetota bacterium]
MSLCLLSALAAQQAPDPSSSLPDLAPYRGTVRDLVKTSLREGQAYEMLRELCRVAPGRLSGSPSAAAAVAWARQTMIDQGLENVRLEPVMVPQWRRGQVARLRVVEPSHASDLSLPVCALGGSIGTEADGVMAEVVEVKSFGALRNLGEIPKGRIVFFNQPMDPTVLQTFQAYGGAVRQRGSGAIEGAKLGALGVVIRSVASNLDDSPHTGAMHYDDAVPKIPAAAVSTLGAERLSRLLAAGERVVLRLDLDCSWHEDVPSHNVVGELVGRELPDEFVVLGGHLDSWDLGEGAHDDGAGCVQSIEVLRLLKAMDLRPRRTVRCVLFMNEENGLRGGRQYAIDHEDELSKHVMALESDRGGFTPRGFTTSAHSEGIEVLRHLASLLADVGAERVYAGGGGADISPMAPYGVPLVGLMPDSHRYFDLHHSKNDCFATVNERELELGAACMAALCYLAADLEEPLPRNPATVQK